MGKHLSFWIGVFAACILGIPIAFGIIAVAEERAVDISSALFGIIVALLFVTLTTFFFGKFLLEKLGLVINDDIEGLVNLVEKLIVGVINRDLKSTIGISRKLVVSLSAYYGWASLYKWVFKTCISLIFMFAAFSGTILLFEQINKLEDQNTKIDVQNELFSLTIYDSIRSRLTSENVIGKDLVVAGTGGCTDSKYSDMKVTINPNKKFYPNPNLSSIEAIYPIAKSSELGEKAFSALHALLQDSDQTAAFGALLVLDKLEKKINLDRLEFRNLILDGVTLKNEYPIVFVNTIVSNFKCKGCDLEFINSVVYRLEADKVSYKHSFADYGSSLNKNLKNIKLDSGNSIIRGLFDVDDNSIDFRIRDSVTHVAHKNCTVYEQFKSVACDEIGPSLGAMYSCSPEE